MSTKVASKHVSKAVEKTRTVFMNGSDWKVRCDEGNTPTVLLEAIVISHRSEMVLFNKQSKSVMTELTVTWESWMMDVRERGMERYEELVADFRERGWRSSVYVGNRMRFPLP